MKLSKNFIHINLGGNFGLMQLICGERNTKIYMPRSM